MHICETQITEWIIDFLLSTRRCNNDSSCSLKCEKNIDCPRQSNDRNQGWLGHGNLRMRAEGLGLRHAHAEVVDVNVADGAAVDQSAAGRALRFARVLEPHRVGTKIISQPGRKRGRKRQKCNFPDMRCEAKF